MTERLCTERRTKVVQFYFESRHYSDTKIVSKFLHVRNAHGAVTIYRSVRRFRQRSAVCDLPCVGRPRAVQNDVNIARARASV